MSGFKVGIVRLGRAAGKVQNIINNKILLKFKFRIFQSFVCHCLVVTRDKNHKSQSLTEKSVFSPFSSFNLNVRKLNVLN